MVQAARVQQGLGHWEEGPCKQRKDVNFPSDLMTCCSCVVTLAIQAHGGLSGELLPYSRRKLMESGQGDGVCTRGLTQGIRDMESGDMQEVKTAEP